jgi:hypothetical protein
MDISKFEYLIQRSALYFRRADLLMRMDRMEGALTNRMKEFFDQKLFTSNFVTDLQRQRVATFGVKTQVQGRLSRVVRDELRQRARAHYKYLLQRTHINCWHINLEENVLMWGQYIPSRSGVAIRSTVEQLRNSLSSTVSEVYGIPVDYVDHSSEPLRREMLPGGMSQIVFDMLSKKRKPFSGEREFRLIADTLTHEEKWAPNLVGSHLDTSVQNSADSISIDLNLEALIDSIFLYPSGESQLRDDVARILDGTDLGKKVKQSVLS